MGIPLFFLQDQKPLLGKGTTMKNFLCFSFLFGAIAFIAVQSDAQSVYIGARVGANLANEAITPNEWSTTSIQPGFIIGGQIDIPLSGFLTLSVQIDYDQKGSNEVRDLVNGSYGYDTESLTYNYLEIPILLKASFGSGPIKPFLFAGPSVAFFLSGTDKIRSTGSFIFLPPHHVDTTVSVQASNINSPDFSAIFGAGISFHLNSGPLLFFDASYALGLVNIDNTDDELTIKSRDIRIAAGALFPID